MSQAMDCDVSGTQGKAWWGGQEWGLQQLGGQRYGLLVCAVAAQLSTILITWPLWQVRIAPPNLPLLAVPQVPFGVVLVISLLYLLIDPRRGLVIHVLLIAAASVFDQFRMQPQVPAIILLMWATVSFRGRLCCRWFLVALWLWAGLHKLLSPDWFAHSSYWILERLDFSHQAALQYQLGFAVSVAVGEILLGLLAICRPRWAAGLCPALHLSIVLLLVTIRWNYSVVPWNLATAVIGPWVLWNAGTTRKQPIASGKRERCFEWGVALLLLIMPAGFYLGIVDRAYAHVLYSDFVPKSLITGRHDLRKVAGWLKPMNEGESSTGTSSNESWPDWNRVNVPFPCERRMHRQFFQLTAQPGDKLHLFDPRPALDDQFLVMSDEGQAVEISRAHFFDERNQLAGVGIDDRRAMFWLRQWGVIKQRWYSDQTGNRDNLVSYAYTLRPEFYSRRALELLAGLPNLEQLQLQDCPVTDQDLELVAKLDRLTGVGLSNTSVTDAGLEHLAKLPHLKTLEIEDTPISPGGLRRLRESLGY